MIIFDEYGTLISTGSGSFDATRKILSLQNEKHIYENKFYAKWKEYHRLHMIESNYLGLNLKMTFLMRIWKSFLKKNTFKNNIKHGSKIIQKPTLKSTFQGRIKLYFQILLHKFHLTLAKLLLLMRVGKK